MTKTKLFMTPELGTRLKDFRNQFKVKARDVAEVLGKSAAYVSKLEKGEIQQIEKNEFIRIVNFITGSNEGYDRFFEYVSDLADEKELEESVLFSNFDWTDRMLPLPKELIEYINNKLEKNKVSCEELVRYINENDDLESTFFEEHKIDKNLVEPNIWYPYSELDVSKVQRSFIWMHVEQSDIEEILKGKKKKSNYLIIYVILYHIYKLEELEKHFVLDDRLRKNIKKRTEDKLHSYKFYTLADKRRRLAQAEDQMEVDNVLSKFDYENRELTTRIIKFLSILSDFDVDYTNEKLKGIINNFEKTDISFAVAYMAISLEKLNDLPNSVKHEFLKRVNELVKKYSDGDYSDSQFEKY